MYVTIWEYRIRPEAEAQFVENYGPDGSWVALFRRASGYVDTRLLQDMDEPQRFVTMDTWVSKSAFERFRQAFAAEYDRIDARCEALTLDERRHGQLADDTA